MTASSNDTKRNVLFIGDSQCDALNAASPPFYGLLAQALADRLREDVHVTFDCAPWRRIASCYGNAAAVERQCVEALSDLNMYCSRQTNTPFSDIIYMLGVNNLKTVLWTPSLTPFPQGDVMSAPLSVQKDAEDFMAAALACNANVTVTAVASLNVQNCGGNYVINTCTNDSGAYVSQYYRSDWLRDIFRSTTIGHGRAAFGDTANVERGDLYYDDFHTSDSITNQNTVNAIVDAVATVAPIGGGPGPFRATFRDMDVFRAWPPPPPPVVPSQIPPSVPSQSPPSVPSQTPPSPPASRPLPTYTLYTTRLSFTLAVQACEARGQTIARITNHEEQLAAASLVHMEGNLISRNKWLQRAVWIGANDKLNEGIWRWVDASGRDAADVITDSWGGGWGAGEPNGGSSIFIGDEDCAVLTDALSWDWADYPCSMTCAYLCEGTPTPSTLGTPTASAANNTCDSKWPRQCRLDSTGLVCSCVLESSLFVVIAGAVLLGIGITVLGFIRQRTRKASAGACPAASLHSIALVPTPLFGDKMVEDATAPE